MIEGDISMVLDSHAISRYEFCLGCVLGTGTLSRAGLLSFKWDCFSLLFM